PDGPKHDRHHRPGTLQQLDLGGGEGPVLVALSREGADHSVLVEERYPEHLLGNTRAIHLPARDRAGHLKVGRRCLAEGDTLADQTLEVVRALHWPWRQWPGLPAGCPSVAGQLALGVEVGEGDVGGVDRTYNRGEERLGSLPLVGRPGPS